MPRKGPNGRNVKATLITAIVILCVFVGFELGKKWERYKFVRVVDGDTISLRNMRTGEEQGFRIMGINAPDNKDCYFYASGAILGKNLLGKNLEYKIIGHDGFGRILGNVYANKVDVAEEMVSSGAAWAYDAAEVHDPLKPNAEYYAALQKLEEVPKSKKMGIWSDLCLK